MDSKGKILLGEKDIISKDNEDLFINLNLNSTFSEIRNDKFENVFDVEKQFKKERNSSRDFRIYGIVDSTIADTDSVNIEYYSDSGATGLFNQISATTSTELVYNEKNVFGKKRGKYIIELNSYSHDFVYIKILSNNTNFKDQIYTQQLVFRDADGIFVEYGTQTIDITENGDAIEINNDFYFLYNKHWIKKDLSIIEEKPAKVSINSSVDISFVDEFSVSSDIVPIEIKLDKPSPFGLEYVDLINLTSTLDGGEIILTDSLNNILYLPITIHFSSGEQSKTYNFYSPLDNIQELVENVTVGLDNFVNVRTGETLQHTIFVADKTARNKVKLNFQDVYQNRNYFTARSGSITPISRESRPMPSVLRNGLFFEGTPMEFYPSDNYTLKIKNVGINTILPVNQKLGINSEQIFYSNQELTFNIKQEYINTEKHAIKFIFKNLDVTTPSYYFYDNGFRLNGVPFVKYGYNMAISYQKFLALFKKTIPSNMFSTVDGWSFSNLETPFDIIEDQANLTITLVAKSPGTRLDVSSFGSFPDLFDMLDDDFDTYGIKAEEVQSFVYDSQIPLEIELGANTGNNLYAQYAFTISKTGYDTMSFTSSTLPADINPITYYMVSGLNTILRNWDDSTNSIVFKHDKVTSDWGANSFVSNPVYGQYKTGEVYINGMVLLANQYLSNTLYYSSNPQGNTPLNQSHAINNSGDLSHDFFPQPITVIPETVSEFSVNSIAQYGFLGISRPTLPTLPTNLDNQRGFDFRHDSAVNFNSFTFRDNYSFGTSLWLSGPFYSDNGPIGTNRPYAVGVSPLPLKTYLETGSVNFGLISQDMIGNTSITNAEYITFIAPNITIGGSVFSDWTKLKSAIPGKPFEFKNFKEMKNTSTGQDYYNYKTMQFIEVQPNQTAGVTLNPGRNFMGGFSVTHP